MYDAAEYSLQWQAYQVACIAGRGELSYASIAQTFWWAITTITVVGYGEVFPQTLKGKMVGIATLTASILLLALPMSIIVNEFQSVYNELQTASPVDIEKLPLSKRLRAQLRDRWLARQESAQEKMGLPRNTISSTASPTAATTDEGNGSQSLAVDMSPKSSKGSADGLAATSHGARLRALEAKIDQANELNVRALEVMRAIIALAAEAGEHARDVEAMDRTMQYYGKKPAAEKKGAAKHGGDLSRGLSDANILSPSATSETWQAREGGKPPDDEPVLREIIRL
jgi:hypothetical protein